MSELARDLTEYEARRVAQRERIQAFGYGWRARVSQDLRLHPTLISQVLNGDKISEAILGRIEAWTP